MSQNTGQPAVQPLDFSLMQGGVFYKLNVKLKLNGPNLEFAHRKILALIGITWLPLLLLSLLQSDITDLKVPFLYNIEVHIRFLIALPIFIYAEVVANTRIRILIRQFTVRHIIFPEDVPHLNKAIQKANKLCNLKLIDVILIILVFTLGNSFWGANFSLQKVDTWYAIMRDGEKHFTLAGDWYAFVSLPIFQFILMRWLFHLFVFGYLLREISKINLQITGLHPDRSGGIGFLVDYVHLITPFVFAISTLSAGGIAGKIFFEGAPLYDFRINILILILSAVFITISPLFIFIPKLYLLKRKYRREYGTLSTRYVHDFYDKWVTGKIKSDEPLLGSADIQSLADLDNSFSIIREIRLVPFTIHNLVYLVIMASLPYVPLLLTAMPIEKIAELLFNTLF